MSRADSSERLLEAAIGLGVREGASAMSLQGIARAANVSKGLVLYHFGDKLEVLWAVAERLRLRSAERLDAVAQSPDALMAWRALSQRELIAGELALLAAIAQEPERVDRPTCGALPREEAAARVVASIFRPHGLVPRVPLLLLGRMLVRHLDGLASAGTRRTIPDGDIEAELDTFAVALLGCGR